MKIKLPTTVKMILDTLHARGYEAYAVGGCVRDSILGRTPDDWDITTNAEPRDVKWTFQNTVDTGIEHGTVTVLIGRDKHEVTTYRIDGKYTDGRHPDEVTFARTLEEDLLRRDFTINAMAYSEEGGLVDLYGGMDDLQRKQIRCVGNADARFGEDALRILRAVRFSAQLNFSIEENTREAIRAHAPELSKISAERIYVELTKLLVSDHPEYLRAAYDLGVTKIILPEFDALMDTPQNNPHHSYNVGEHTLEALRQLAGVTPQKDRAADASAGAEGAEAKEAHGAKAEAEKEAAHERRLLRLAMLLHDIGKPACRSTDARGVDHFKMHGSIGADMAAGILRRLKADNRTIHGAKVLIKYHDWRMESSKKSVRRALNKIGAELFPLLLQLQWADTMAQSEWMREEKLERISNVAYAFERIMEKGECIDLAGLAISGKDLIDLGVPPGPRIGELLELALREVLDDPLKNTREELMKIVEKNLT